MRVFNMTGVVPAVSRDRRIIRVRQPASDGAEGWGNPRDEEHNQAVVLRPVLDEILEANRHCRR